MARFFSMDEFMYEVAQALEMGEAYEETHDESLLEVEIATWRCLLPEPIFKHTPQDFQALTFGRAGQSFFNRYHNKKRLEDLIMTRRLFSEGLQHVTDTSVHATLLHSLGDVLTNLYREKGKLEDLEESIAYYRDAIAYLDPDDANWLAYMDDLGTALRDHYTHTGNLPSLDESIKTHREVLSVATVSSSNPAAYFNHLGMALLDRYHHVERLEDLQEAVESFEQAVQHAPLDARPGYLSNLSNALSSRGEHLNEIADLERAIQLRREAVRLAPEEAYIRTGLGIDLGRYYTFTGQLQAIDSSIAIFQKIIEETPSLSPDLPDYHVNLAKSLQNRYDGLAHLENLQRAISHYRIALELLPSSGELAHKEQKPLVLDASARSSYSYNLAGALLFSYLATGRVAHLQEAIQWQREALRFLPATAVSSQAEYRRALSNLLLHLHNRERRLEPLNEAIKLAAYGTQHLDTHSPQLAKMYNALGNALRQRYLAAHDPADIQQTIAAYRKALAATKADSPEISNSYGLLGNALWNSYTDFHGLQELEEAIANHRLALDLYKGELAINRAAFLSNLGIPLLERYTLFHQQQDLEEARNICEEACRSGAPEIARGTARPWGNMEANMGNWDEAAQAYRYAVQAQEKLYQVQLLLIEREGLLGEESEIYARAAYILARVGRFQEAVTTLEQGRAKRLGEALERDRADLQRVEKVDLQAFRLYQDAASQLRQLERTERDDWLLDPEHGKVQRRGAVAPYEQISRAREDLEEAIKRIRQLPGLRDFLREPTFPSIVEAALPAHPLAYLVTSPWGRLILLVQHEKQEAEALFVDTFTDREPQKLLSSMSADLSFAEHVSALISRSRPKLSQALQAVLPQLGNHLIGPLARRLHEIGATGVTLIPVGQLSILPLHAARYERGGQETTLLDEFDVTYTPSARVLNSALREAQQRTAPFHLLAVGDPDTALPGPPRLIHAHAEVEQIVGLFPPQASTPLYESAATLDAVWEQLPQATITHFACHGYFDPMEPLNSELLLANKTHLTLRALLNAGPHLLAHLRTAVLSACESILTGQQLPDEVIGLPAGFLQAGVPLVVGTLWSVHDESTKLLMIRFYELQLRGDPHQGLAAQPPARALRLAQRWLRDLTQDELDVYEVASRGDRQLATIEQIEQGKASLKPVHPYADPSYWAAFVYYGAPLAEHTAVGSQHEH
jgi:CHAT domain-containing protein